MEHEEEEHDNERSERHYPPSSPPAQIPIEKLSLEELRYELAAERASKAALENMLVMSSINMIGKIDALERKHEAQIDALKEELKQHLYPENEEKFYRRYNEDDARKSKYSELEKKTAKEKKKVELQQQQQPLIDLSKKKTTRRKEEKTLDDEDDPEEDKVRDIAAEALGAFGDLSRMNTNYRLPFPTYVPPPRRKYHSAMELEEMVVVGGVQSRPHDGEAQLGAIKRRKTDTTLANIPLPEQNMPTLQGGSLSTIVDGFTSYSSYSSNMGPVPSQASTTTSTTTSPSVSNHHNLNNNNNNNNNNGESSSSKSISSPPSSSSLPLLTLNRTPGTPLSPPDKLLLEVQQLVAANYERKEKIHIQQRQILTSFNQRDDAAIKVLDSENLQMRVQIESFTKSLKEIEKQYILEPSQLFRMDFLLQDLRVQQKQLEIYHSELTQSITLYPPYTPMILPSHSTSTPQNEPHSRCHCALVIIKQPFPMVISKFKQLQEEQLVVQMLTGAATSVETMGNVRVEIESLGKTVTKGSVTPGTPSATKKQIDYDQQPLDQARGIARFPIKFMTGTRKSCVSLRFAVNVKISGTGVPPITATVLSHPSQPFIVITNDCQWECSEGSLLKNEVFLDVGEVTWSYFVNVLQRHFLKATRQSPVQPARPLSHFDFQYLSSKFFGLKSTVNHKSFDNFWNWFGKALQTLRYKRHISTLWQNGLVFMFMTRDKVNQILQGQEPGTFLILFSEIYAGQLEISYVIAQDSRNPEFPSNFAPITPPPLSDSSSLLMASSPSPSNPLTPPSTPIFVSLNNHINGSTPNSVLSPSSSSGSLSTSSNSTSLGTKIKHYLVSANDTIGSKRTLPDFLSEYSQFTHVLQLNVPSLTGISDWSSVSPTSNFPFKKFPKDQVLEPYYSKRGSSSPSHIANGYDPLE